MNWTIDQIDKRLVVRPAGKLDAQSAPALEEDMSEKLEGISEIVFDLSSLEYISSAGLRIMLASFKLMNKRGGTMQVEHANEDVLSILQMSGFASIFDIEL